ncbi:hypothetical protein NP493_613g00002 [Ridgeia piscesae]|uniref:Uncharacterized protein n=1 Tax=Ridgeia piscesae TaxID=27915 RepID=A0AAD9KT53_RIDPI|nr:hypothetical protein NP493_613g00002 [Ridgeia piscesae]
MKLKGNSSVVPLFTCRPCLVEQKQWMTEHAKRQRQYRARMKQQFGEMYMKRERDRIARYRQIKKEQARLCLAPDQIN